MKVPSQLREVALILAAVFLGLYVAIIASAIGLAFLLGGAFLWWAVLARQEHLLVQFSRPILRAIAPLALTMFVLLAFSLQALTPLVAMVGAALVVHVGWVLVREERPEQGLGRPLFLLAVATFSGWFLAFGIPTLVSPFWEPDWLRKWFLKTDELGGTLTFLEWGALALWLFALVLRLISYACERWWHPPVAVLLVSGLVLPAAFAGFVPGWFLSVALVLAIFLFAATAVAWLHHRSASQPPTSLRLTAQRLGLVLAILSAALLASALVLSRLGTASSTTIEWRIMKPVRPGLTKHIFGFFLPDSPVEPRKLAEEFLPFPSTTFDERWFPVRVDSYLQEARLLRSEDGKQLVARGNLSVRGLGKWASCRTFAPRDCWTLTTDCASGERSCALTAPYPRTVYGYNERGAVYARVLHRGSPPDDGSPDAFADWSPFGEKLSVLLQYWLFYPYDEWRTVTAAGTLVQRHEADWEAVTIGLSSRDGLFVAFSAHCGGRWVAWRDATRVFGKRIYYLDGKPADPPLWTVYEYVEGAPANHPLVAVAEGSHANYEQAGSQRAPEWGRCRGVPSDAVDTISYVSNVRDRTDDVSRLIPEVILVDAETPPMNFPGIWGKTDQTVLKPPFRSRPVFEANGNGPHAPPLQALWRHPLRTIFCGRNWKGPESCKSS